MADRYCLGGRGAGRRSPGRRPCRGRAIAGGSSLDPCAQNGGALHGKSVAGCPALTLSPAPANAAIEGLPIGWGWSSLDGEITVTIEAFDQIEDVELTLTRGHDRHRYRFDRSSMSNGDTWSVDIPMPSRTTEIAVRVDATYAGEESYYEDGFEVSVFAEMDFDVDLDSFDADGRGILS